MPRDVSIVLVGDNNDNNYGEKVWDMGKELGKVRQFANSNSEITPTDARPSSISILS
jgi:hypothetical protein